MDEVIKFEIGQKEYPVEIKIVDDTEEPLREGFEFFYLMLLEPEGTVIGMPEEAKVIINDEQVDGKCLNEMN